MNTSVAILCPITSLGCGGGIAKQPIFQALLPSMTALRMWGDVTLYLGYDDDDPIWSRRNARATVHHPVTWIPLHGLHGKITAIWNAMALEAGPFDYLIPANDDLAFETSPLPAIDVLAARRGFGTCAFADSAFPGLPTFYVVGRTHFAIFGDLYPLPWQGAHQDPWIADVYRPWGASEIDARFQCHNHIGTGPRFEYGDTNGYREEVLRGRRKVNLWLKSNHNIADPLSAEWLEAVSMLL